MGSAEEDRLYRQAWFAAERIEWAMEASGTHGEIEYFRGEPRYPSDDYLREKLEEGSKVLADFQAAIAKLDDLSEGRGELEDIARNLMGKLKRINEAIAIAEH